MTEPIEFSNGMIDITTCTGCGEWFRTAELKDGVCSECRQKDELAPDKVEILYGAAEGARIERAWLTDPTTGEIHEFEVPQEAPDV